MTLPAQTDVLVVGAGPVGLTLANLLGGEAVATLLVERNADCVPEPRAVALDGESLRTLQAAGLVDNVLPHLRQGFVADYVNGEGVRLFSTDLTARPFGYCLQNSFDQPTLERQLLAGLSRFECVTVSHSTALLRFEQDDTGVTAVVQDPAGRECSIRARYLVACDGGRSGIRQALGIAMVGERLPQRWLVIDTVDPVLGEEPACRFFCDPRRPAMTIIRPGAERRWEWMLLEGEDSDDLLDDDRIRALLAEHTDPDRVTVYRKCVYHFSAVVAERFSDGRVFLAGDAAHMTPPFAGQGLNAGIRDVRNLAWKLARVLAGTLPPALLDTYQQERREAAKAVVDLAVELGERIQPTDPAAAAERDAFFAALNADPAAAAAFGADGVAALSDIRLPAGWFAAGRCGGRMLPQPPVTPAATGPVLLDGLLGNGFCALVRGTDALPEAVTGHPLWRAMAPRLIYLDRVSWQLPEAAIDGFRAGAGAGVTLLRPDRFLLADLALEDQPAATLDELQAMLMG